MLETVLSTLSIMGWLGIVLAILVIVNIVSSAIYNVWSKKESFCWKKMIKGFTKALVFYLGAAALSVAFAMLPFINDMISDVFKTTLIGNETLETLSSVGVLGTVVTAIVTQGKKAITGILKLSEVSTTEAEEITWTVEEE